MSSYFDVVGDVMGDELEGDVMGDDEVVGVVRRNRQTGRKTIQPAGRSGGRQIALPPKPEWRNQLAPGVTQPDEGMIPLPLAPAAGSPPGTFTSALSQITFQGQLQKPFRAERFLVSTVRTGTTAIGRLMGVLYVGTDLQQAEIAAWDIELIGQANSFGTRLTCKAAEPGVLIRLVVTLSQNITSTADSIFASVLTLGRVIH